jgi:hypothetical protein
LRWGTEKAKSALDMAADAISRSRAGKVDTDNGGGIGRVVRICLALEAQEDLEVLSALLSCAGSVRYEFLTLPGCHRLVTDGLVLLAQFKRDRLLPRRLIRV